jgi:hypothetical protein
MHIKFETARNSTQLDKSPIKKIKNESISNSGSKGSYQSNNGWFKKENPYVL